jgi:hypothetical protein
MRSVSPQNMGLPDDDRGVSNVIGAVFILGFVVVLLSVHQATVIPNQNKKTEFDHFTHTQNDMLELRNAILEAKRSGETTFAEVRLGTTYPNRIVGVNPPDPSGSLRTGDTQTILIEEAHNSQPNESKDVCPSKGATETRILTYKPNYHEFRNAPTIVYENTVLYLQYNDQTVLLTDEELVDEDEIKVSPLNTSISETAVKAKAVNPVPGANQKQDIDDPSVQMPTMLSEDKWEELLRGEIDQGNITVTGSGEVKTLTITTGGTLSVSCSPTGLNNAPGGGKRGTAAEIGINPAAPGDIQLVGERQGSQSSGTIELKFKNQANATTNVTQARLNFFNSDKKRSKEPEQVRIYNGTSQSAGVLPRGETFQKLAPDVFLPANDTRIIRVDLENSDGTDINNVNNLGKGWFVLTLQFETGETGTYFIPVPSSSSF